MSRGKNGLIGGIRSTFWRRAALVTFGAPMLFLGLLPTYLSVLPHTLWNALLNAWDEFTDTFGATYQFPNSLLVLTAKSVWSKDWKPAQ